MLVTPTTETAPDGRKLGLTIGRNYEVLGIEADYYRLLTDESHPCASNDPCLFEPECFRIVDDKRPIFWITKLGEGGEEYAYPAQWERIGFFEDYHDRIESVRQQFWADLRALYPWTANDRAITG
ncbi:hypothetical protein Enr13x_32840 [Stieleria neptunia]|uniref:Uncharacterized protein n=2 Tax=Stieleria neptunia TaxID=2527979 RepID=A0A518HRG5_9BACT|nr:hypothetical protein Enr13x_32840 [Stieleria neptunia]